MKKSSWNLARIILPIALVFAFLLFSAGWNIPADESYAGVSLMGILYVNPMARLFEFALGVSACRVFRSMPENLTCFRGLLCPYS